MIKNTLLVLIALIVIFFLNKFVSPVASLEKSAQCEDLSAARKDLISISQNEYLEYTKIKDLKLKYEKADELLGKVMLLFLADIGFKASKMSVSEMESSVNEPLSETSKTEIPKAEVSASASMDKAVTPSTDLVNEGLKNKSVLIRNLKSQAQINEVLDKALIDNPKVAVASGSLLNSSR